MRIEKRLRDILDRASAGLSPGRADCAYLLSFDENAAESYEMRSVAARLVRGANDNSAIILGQIGLEAAPCPGNCGFCSFGKGHTQFQKSRIDDETFISKLNDFCKDGDLYGLYLMSMHEYDLDFFLDKARLARKLAPATTQILSNVGDTDADGFKEMKKAGITGVYHVSRIGEGDVTDLDPKRRLQTMQNALDAGLQIFSCLEPIGPEHSIEELVENMFIGIDLGCTQHAAMRREPVPGTPLENKGQISNLRLGQIVATVALATLSLPSMTYMGVHEPSEIGYVSGANVVTAETGVNPRDAAADTAHGRGMDMAACRRMLLDCGFRYIRRGDESKIALADTAATDDSVKRYSPRP
ncbi:MAG: radical SAM protein [Clostridiales Family XIII bacterium]|jgi:biotin synthase|nr:radical SAM protein [Clostridiales Family XIII bacterium]